MVYNVIVQQSYRWVIKYFLRKIVLHKMKRNNRIHVKYCIVYIINDRMKNNKYLYVGPTIFYSKILK